MKSFNVYQLSERSPALRDLFFLTPAQVAEHAEDFRLVSAIRAKDLEDVFDVGNIGPESQITRYKSMRSVSVGDIIEDTETGRFFVVAKMGFEEVSSTHIEQLHANSIGI